MHTIWWLKPHDAQRNVMLVSAMMTRMKMMRLRLGTTMMMTMNTKIIMRAMMR